MDKKLLALLEKSQLFSAPNRTSFSEASVQQVEEFNFWLPNCFYSEKKDPKDVQVLNFERELKRFFHRYLDAWVNLVESDSKNPFKWKEYSSALVEFFLKFDGREYFDLVVGGDITVFVPITPNNSQLSIRRIGDILAFNVSRIQSPMDDHKTGRKAVEFLCRAEDRGNNHGVYELIQGVRVSLPLLGERTENGGSEKKVNFKSMETKLRRFLPAMTWNFRSSELVDSYKRIDREGMTIGEYFGLRISARLVHCEAKGKEDVVDDRFQYSSRARIWRDGNVERVNEWKYIFKEGEDIFLVLSLEGSFPQAIYKKIDTSLRIHREQFILANAGVIFSAGLCSMMLDAYQRHSIELGN